MQVALRAQASGPSPADEAWERYAEPARWSSWSPQVRGVLVEGERIRPGLTGTVVGPIGIRPAFEVLTVDERARRWSWRVRLGAVVLVLDHGVEAADDGGSRTTLVVRCAPWLLPVAAGYLPVATLALHRLVGKAGSG